MCPECGNYNAYVVDSREEVGYRRRRYKCADCDHRWTTAEIPLERLKLLEEKRRAPLEEIRQAKECLNRFLEREAETLD